MQFPPEIVERVREKVTKMVLRSPDVGRCPKGADVFDHQMKTHEALAGLIDVSPNFHEFNANMENRAFFELWRSLLRRQSGSFTAGAWKWMEQKSQQERYRIIDGQIAVGMWQAFFFGNFLQNRGRRFRLSRNLAEVLLHTDIRVPAQDLRPPCTFMAVELPSGILSMVEEGKEAVSCRYLLVTRQRMIPKDMAEECDRSEDGQLDTINILAIGESQGTDEFGDLTLVDTLSLREGLSVDDEIRAYIERRRVFTLGDHLRIEVDADGPSRYSNPVANIFALTANILLYCTNRGADLIPHNQATLEKLQRQVSQHVKGSKKRSKATQKLQEAKASSIIVIGGNFRPKDGRVLEYCREDRKVSVRHLVRGHWKMQAYGPDRQDRKHIFVEPYWRGPELAEMVQRDYVLK